MFFSNSMSSPDVGNLEISFFDYPMSCHTFIKLWGSRYPLPSPLFGSLEQSSLLNVHSIRGPRSAQGSGFLKEFVV